MRSSKILEEESKEEGVFFHLLPAAKIMMINLLKGFYTVFMLNLMGRSSENIVITSMRY